MNKEKKVTHIVIHHSFTGDTILSDRDAIERYHREHNGWPYIGYDYVVEQVNGVYVAQAGHDRNLLGYHCKEAHMNWISDSFCVVGNFDTAPPGIELLRFLVGAVWAVMVNRVIPASNVIGHREAGLMAGYDWSKGQYKSCPGALFPMDTLRQLLAGKIDHDWIPGMN